MSVLVFGRTGQVATELQRHADVVALGRDAADLSDAQACAAAIRAHRPRAVINAAAYTAVDRAESDEAQALRVNAESPAAMARECVALGVPFVTISTDYVFDGTGTDPFAPDAPTGPLGAYGRSKLAGEEAVRAAGGVQAILRTSWVFSAHGANFVKTMLRLSETRDSLTVVADQIGGPTPARAIAEACLTIAAHLGRDPGASGTYHFAGAPDVSWADFAREIFARAGRATKVTSIPTADYPTPARRPQNSRLDCRTTEAVFGIARPDWRLALTQTLTELDIPT
ncbi:dTDP-4-dehydrorhamnose reductase [Pararhodobacter aggregans]|uniref:dTDP-4-dehydrorhamnose reductase n=1 Tax=Pararhodobacter aggregans TaxID=404875 RepID=UPI003A8FF7CF